MGFLQDKITQVYGKIWSLMTSDPRWQSLVKTQVRYDLNQTSPKALNTNANDYPMAILEVKGFSDTLFTKDPTLETFASEFDPTLASWTEMYTQEYLLTLISRQLKLSEWDDLAILAIAGLRRAGPRLGLQYVTCFGDRQRGIIATVKETDQDEARGTRRLVTTIPIAVEMTFEGRDLVNDSSPDVVYFLPPGSPPPGP